MKRIHRKKNKKKEKKKKKMEASYLAWSAMLRV